MVLLKIGSMLRFVNSFVSYKLGRPRLSYIVYICTTRCNLRCAFCDVWKKKEQEMGPEEALKVVKDIAGFGVSVIGFTGGEPTMRRDLEKLASTARSLGVFTSLNTNGTMINRRRAKKIGKSFDIVNVSLDGFKETHDSVRGITDTFEAAIKGLQNLQETGVKLGICLTINKKNLHEVVPLFLQFRGLVDFVSFQPVQPYPPPPDLALTPEEAEVLVKDLLALKEEDSSYVAPLETYVRMIKSHFSRSLPRICDAGSLYAWLEPDGKLLGCSGIRGSYIGDLTKETLKDLWSSERRLLAQDAVLKCGGCLMQCTALLSMAHRGMFTLKDAKGALSTGLLGRKPHEKGETGLIS